MATSNVCWGIEVGAGAVKAVKVERDGESLKVVDFAVIPHKKVLSTPDLDQLDAIRVGVGALVSQHDLKKAMIAISIPGHSAFARFAKLPPVEPKKIPDIVKFEAVQQIPFPIEEVEWDYQTFANPESPDVEVGIFAVTRERVMERLAQWHDVGVTPDIVNLSPIAVFNAVAYDMAFTNKTPGTVILDVGATSTDLIVAEAGRVWVRTFPIGGHQFTEALVEAFKLTYPKAEKLKREAETSKHARHVFQAMRPVFSDLAQEVQRSIGYYQSLHRDANLTRLIVLGSTFNLPGLKKYLGQQLQMEVVQLGQFNRLSVDGPRSGEFQAATLNIATAYGLALQGLGLGAIDANLMPVAVLREAMWKGKVKWFAAAAALSVVAGAVSFTGYFIDDTALRAKPAGKVIEQTKRELATLKQEWQTISSAYVPDYSAANASLLLENREIIPWIVDDLGHVMESAKLEAQQTAKPEEGPRGLVFQKFQTQYLSAGSTWMEYPSGGDAGTPFPSAPEIPRAGKGGAAPRGADGLPGDRVEGRSAPRPPMPSGEPEGTVTDEDGPRYSPSAGPPRVLCTLTVKTARKDPYEFLTNTVQKWLTENKQRDGAPYSIKHIAWRPVGQEVVAADPNAAQRAAGQPPSVGRPSGRSRPDEPPAYDPYNPPEGVQRPGQESSAGDPNTIAPIPKPAPIAEPGTTVVTFEITWEAYIKESKDGVKPEGGA